jgi:hypothetical protein
VTDSLTPEERGFLASLAGLGAEKAVVEGAFASEALCAAWSTLRDGDRDRRVSTLSDLMRDAAVPGPPEGLDPSWLVEALAGEPTGLALALGQEDRALAEAAAELARRRGEEDAAPWPLEPEVRLELRRLVLSSVAALAAAPVGPVGQELVALEGRELMTEVARWGARTIGTSLAGTPVDVRARAMASAGAPWATDIAAASARHLDPRTRENARLLVARVAALPAPTPLHGLRALGLLALGPALAAEGTASALAVAGRLPVELGRALLAAC